MYEYKFVRKWWIRRLIFYFVAALCKDFRDRDQLTDVTLIVGDSEVRAHKLLLAATIPYFHKMFCSGMVETNKEIIPILLELSPGRKLCPNSFRAIIDFVYSGNIALNVDNVQVRIFYKILYNTYWSKQTHYFLLIRKRWSFQIYIYLSDLLCFAEN